MSASAFSALLVRITDNMPAGRAQVIRNVASISYGLEDARNKAAKRDDLSSRGRAQIIDQYVKTRVAADYARARRQLAYHAQQLEKQRVMVRTKAIGADDRLDAERRTVLRGMTPAEATQIVLTDPEFRGAALRGGANLAGGLSAEVMDRALAAAIRENAPAESATLEVAEEVYKLHDAAMRMLTYDILQTPFIVTESGSIRKFNSQQELDQFAAVLPVPGIATLALEEKELDAA